MEPGVYRNRRKVREPRGTGVDRAVMVAARRRGGGPAEGDRGPDRDEGEGGTEVYLWEGAWGP